MKKIFEEHDEKDILKEDVCVIENETEDENRVLDVETRENYRRRKWRHYRRRKY